MNRDFYIYASLTVLGLLFRAASDVDQVLSLSWNGDYLWGVGLAIILLACAIFINKKTPKGSGKLFTRFFLFTAISNFCDETLFDPYRVSWQEWVTAVAIGLIIYFLNKYELVRGNRS